MAKRARGRRVTDDDKLVGQQLRIARMATGLTQSDVGAKIGVTFQQVQKYERGDNRISATRLRILLAVYDTTFDKFFEGTELAGVSPGKVTAENPAMMMAGTRNGYRMARAWNDIKNRKVRDSILAFAEFAANPSNAEDED